MKFKDVSPFIRFVQRFDVTMNSLFQTQIAVDARLFYVTDGCGLMEVASKPVKLEAGGLIVINSGVQYRILHSKAAFFAVNFDFTRDYSDLSMPIPPLDAAKPFDDAVIHKTFFDDAKYFNQFKTFENCGALSDLFDRMESEYCKKLPYFENELTATMTSVLARLARKTAKNETKDDRFDIEGIITYIQEHYDEPLDNRKLAEVFHYHPNYLSGKFREIIGKPVHRYLLEFRILKACSMIKTNRFNLSEVAEACGFCDPNYFSRYFKKIIGVSPSEFTAT